MLICLFNRACGNDLSIGDVLDEFSKKFCIYTEYADTVQRSLAALAESQMKNSGLNTFIENVDRNPRCKGKTLRDALELPMSHVDAYLTFLKEMNISTHELHPDSPHIRAALEAVSAQLVKIKKPETNQERIIRRIDARFKGLKESFAGKKGRKFVCETNAKLLQIGSKALEEEIDTTIFLFSDILVVAKLTQKKMCKLLDCIPLIEIIAGNADDSPTCFKIQRNSTGSSFQSGYTFSLPSAREQKLLLDAVNK